MELHNEETNLHNEEKSNKVFATKLLSLQKTNLNCV